MRLNERGAPCILDLLGHLLGLPRTRSSEKDGKLRVLGPGVAVRELKRGLELVSVLDELGPERLHRAVLRNALARVARRWWP
jgi:hypothetical protein